MISYKDMTFCRGEGCLNFGGCFRALTPKIIDGAKKFGLPISQFSDPTQLDCYLVVKSEPKQSSDGIQS